MGTSKSYRAGPHWQEKNTPGGKTKVSKGNVMNAEGTHMSGAEDYGRKGMRKSSRMKSRSHKTSYKNPGPHGYS